MRKYLIVILISNLACMEEIQITSVGKNISYEMGKKSPKISNAVIHFMDGFSSVVAVYKSEKLVLEKEMYTDESLSYAGNISISDLKEGETITMRFNNEIVEYRFSSRYPEIEIYNFPNSLKVNFSKIKKIRSYE